MMQSLPSPRYLELRTHDKTEKHTKHDETADQDESLLGMEDEERAWSDITARDPGMPRRRVSKRQRVWSALMSIRSLLDTVLLVIILGLLLERGLQRPAWFEVGGDVAGFAPRSKHSTQLDGCRSTDIRQYRNKSSHSFQTPCSSPPMDRSSLQKPSDQGG